MEQNLFLRRTIVSVIGAVLILWFGYWLMETLGNRETEVKQMSFREAAKKVEVAPVEYKSREIALSGLGKVVSESAIDLIAEVQGEILAGNVLLKRGTSFRKGQTLFRINNKEARLNLYAQKSNFMTSIASVMPDLRIDFTEAYPRWQAYFEALTVEERLPALPEMKTAKEKVFFSSRNILNQFYSIQSAEERLSKYVVRAPFSGSIVDVTQEVNSVINPGGRVARIARSNRLELEVPFQTADLEYVKRGMEVDVLSEDRTNRWRGKITRIGTSLDASTQTINLYVSFNPGNASIFEGQFLMAEVPGSKIRNVMEIPRNAVFNRNQIYVVKDSMRLVSKEIEIEKINQETVLFTGVAVGELIVTQPLLNAYDNMPVQIIDEM